MSPVNHALRDVRAITKNRRIPTYRDIISEKMDNGPRNKMRDIQELKTASKKTPICVLF